MKNGVLWFDTILFSVTMRTAGTSAFREFAATLGIHAGDKVLDYGSGSGMVAYYAAAANPEGSIVCADTSARRLDVCRKRLRRYAHACFVDIGINPDPFEAEEFDIIYSHFSLHEMADRTLSKACEKFYRWVKPGGRILFREPAGSGSLLRMIDRALSDAGFGREITRIKDIPWVGNAYEGIYKKPSRQGAIAGKDMNE